MTAPTQDRPASEVARPGQARSTELVSDEGRTAIADSVVAKVVGIAVREVPGVHAMGAGRAGALGAMRDRLQGSPGAPQGVGVEVGERQAAVDLDLIVDYGVSIPDLAAGVRRNVANAVEKICGLDVTEINIAVDDVHLPSEDGEEPAESRVE